MKKILLLMTSALLMGVSAFAENKEVVLIKNTGNTKPDEFSIPTIPVQVTIEKTTLVLHFGKVKQVFVSVIGEEGVVYQREITTETAKTIYVDLAKYRVGEYSIYFLDAKGNQLSGDFFTEKN